MNNPTKKHINATYKILQYLKSNLGKGLYFKNSQNREVKAFTDVDWVSLITDHRSSTSYCTYM